MMLDCRFAMSDGTGDTKLLALIDSSALFKLKSSLVAKRLGWAIKPNNTQFAVKLANGKIVYSLDIANRLVSSSVWQAYVTFFLFDILFKVILDIPWLSCTCPWLDWGIRKLHI